MPLLTRGGSNGVVLLGNGADPGCLRQVMKLQRKSTEPIGTPGESIPSARERASRGAWKVSGKTLTIDEFIEYQRQRVDAIDLCVLAGFGGRLLQKVKRENADDYPGLREAVYVIVQALESPAARQVKDPLPNWLAEIAFAAEYLLKGFGVIPDHLPDIGLADDARLLQRIIERNRLELHSALAECISVAAGDSRWKNLALD
jgi:uncharacterized membrane protein YkvA (DUF1232 family)